MFPEHRSLITQLKKNNDAHFAKLFNAHNELDTEIDKLENDPVFSVSRASEIEEMKVKKLALKDELGAYLAEQAKVVKIDEE